MRTAIDARARCGRACTSARVGSAMCAHRAGVRIGRALDRGRQSVSKEDRFRPDPPQAPPPSGHCAVRQDRPLFSNVLPRDRSLHWSLAVIHDPHNCIDDPAAASARTSEVRACHETHPANLCELAPQACGPTSTRVCPSKRSRQLIDGCAISAALVASPRTILGSYSRRMLPLRLQQPRPPSTAMLWRAQCCLSAPLRTTPLRTTPLAARCGAASARSAGRSIVDRSLGHLQPPCLSFAPHRLAD